MLHNNNKETKVKKSSNLLPHKYKYKYANFDEHTPSNSTSHQKHKTSNTSDSEPPACNTPEPPGVQYKAGL